MTGQCRYCAASDKVSSVHSTVSCCAVRLKAHMSTSGTAPCRNLPQLRPDTTRDNLLYHRKKINSRKPVGSAIVPIRPTHGDEHDCHVSHHCDNLQASMLTTPTELARFRDQLAYCPDCTVLDCKHRCLAPGGICAVGVDEAGTKCKRYIRTSCRLEANHRFGSSHHDSDHNPVPATALRPSIQCLRTLHALHG
jgi:hypothetical protein